MALITYAKLTLQQPPQGQSLRNTCFPAVMAQVPRGDSECRCVDSHFPASVAAEPRLRPWDPVAPGARERAGATVLTAAPGSPGRPLSPGDPRGPCRTKWKGRLYFELDSVTAEAEGARQGGWDEGWCDWKARKKGLPWAPALRSHREGRFHPGNRQHVTIMQQGERV